ncbi:MAG TPA: flavodoxin domain-containing protein [Thermotogota bacterium]|nr:flavodoxin domain-containing protein [Thermotogota bacterium]HRW91555.1 flavodoxin domain-containing protein [Thermotogota bacterium]
MHISVVYYSMTGHSRKIAAAIASEFGVTPCDSKKNPQLGETDLLFVLGGIYGGKSSPKLLHFLEKLEAKKVKRAAILTSSGPGTTQQPQVRQALQKKGIECVPEEYCCKGSFLFFNLGHPNQQEIQHAVEFAKKVAAQTQKPGNNP